MFDPLLKAAFVTVVFTVLKILVLKYAPGFPINEEQINAIAFWVVTWLLSLLANKAKALVEKQGKLMLEKPVKPSTTRSGEAIDGRVPWLP